jgi:hypothetical protein
MSISGVTLSLPEAVMGRIRIWPKADSRVYSDGYTVIPAD